MSAKRPSRAFAQGQVRQLQRMKQPLALTLLIRIEPRNTVARALAQRAASSAAGRHVRSRGAQRRAETVALARLVRGLDPAYE
jgi:hypothetical protein